MTMAYEKKCENCGTTIEISNTLRRKGSVTRDNQLIKDTDIHGNTVYKTNINLTIGKCHDTSDYYCSEDCYKTYAVIEEL